MQNNSQPLVGGQSHEQKRKRLDKTEDLEGVLKGGLSARESLEKRLLKHVTKTDSGCWEWTGCLTPNGYPQIAFKRRAHYAHRLSYATFVGPIPTGAFMLHGCDNPKCINPAHLRTGNQKDNIGDAVSKKRHAFGIRQGKAKLNDDLVRRIRDEYRYSKIAMDKIANRLNISRSTIAKAIRGEKWKHVPL